MEVPALLATSLIVTDLPVFCALICIDDLSMETFNFHTETFTSYMETFTCLYFHNVDTDCQVEALSSGGIIQWGMSLSEGSESNGV
jgi:hypothetical protein